MNIIALITDFGVKDWFVGEMKGVMYGISAKSTIVDITHEIPFGDINSAAFVLLACFSSFPAGTVFCTVVDPGVGSNRKTIAAQNDNFSFVGPDNGVLSWALAKENINTVYQISNNKLFRKPVSTTFHARDIFGPVSSHLSNGLPVSELGPSMSDFVKIPFPQPSTGNIINGEILYIDCFGNAITNIESKQISHINSPLLRILKNNLELPGGTFYGQADPQKGLFYFGSAGFVEIGSNGANAAKQLGLHIGDEVEILSKS